MATKGQHGSGVRTRSATAQSQSSSSSGSSQSQLSEGFPAISLDVVQEFCPVEAQQEKSTSFPLSQESLASVDDSTLRQFSPLRSPKRRRKQAKKAKKELLAAKRALVFDAEPSAMPFVSVNHPRTVITCSTSTMHSTAHPSNAPLFRSTTIATFGEPKRSPRRVSPRTLHRMRLSTDTRPTSVQSSNLRHIAPASTPEPQAQGSTSAFGEKLRAAIRRKKKREGLPEDEKRKMAEDKLKERRERRKEQNKRAAQRSREKKREKSHNVLQDYQRLQSTTTALRYEISQLQQERTELVSVLRSHMSQCKLQVPPRILSIITHSDHNVAPGTTSSHDAVASTSSAARKSVSFESEPFVRYLHDDDEDSIDEFVT